MENVSSEATTRTEDKIETTDLTPAGGPTLNGVYETDVSRAMRRTYNTDVQMAPHQIEAIAAAIKSRGPNCNMLVFGLGNDSPLWAALNSSGYTLFLEDVQEWITKVVSMHPTLNVQQVSYAGTTVASALQTANETVAEAKAPLFLLERHWDVIVIDGPMGYASHLPGRALPICWTRQISTMETHIFVDDYERQLERSYTNSLFRHRMHSAIELKRPATDKVSASAMAWLIGCSDPLLGK